VVVRIGSRVKVADEDGLSEFVIVTPDQADLVSGLVSAESAMGRAVLGRPVGAQATVETRFGQRRVWIVAAGEDGA
jgi:transcription elongation GreA/GreB family factor